jgi:hypothetical protein
VRCHLNSSTFLFIVAECLLIRVKLACGGANWGDEQPTPHGEWKHVFGSHEIDALRKRSLLGSVYY